ncbi:thiol reductant ABC exporter subunit CydD [Marinobacter mobilis]|uniref:thiol reductant ABC exporter subunit CydD n=1 Tax=Marinobacter mobilis TaxID=488533 RepID=UPI0035C675A2
MPATTNTGHARRWLSGLTRGHRRSLSLTVAFGALSGLATIVQMGLIAYIAHRSVIAGARLDSLAVWLAPLVFSILVRGLAQGLQGQFANAASEQVRVGVRSQLLSAWREAGPQQLKHESPASLASEWLEQVDALHGYVAHFLPQMALCVIVPLSVLLVVGSLDWLAALFLLLSAPLIPLFMALVGMGAEKLNQQHFELVGRLSGQFLDKVRGLTTLQLFDATDRASQELEHSSDRYRTVTMKTLKVAFLSSAVLEFFSSVAIAVVAIYIGFGLLGYIDYGPAEKLTLFSGLFILMLAPEFFQPLRQLALHYHDRAAALGAAELLMARLEANATANTAQAPDTVMADASDTRALEVNKVTVVYPSTRAILDNVSLSLPRGECLALHGPSGGGKTTLLNVMAGFVVPQSGSVSVFGKAPGSVPFGWLGQSPFILHGSWADNLRMVAPAANDDDIRAALNAVGLAALVSQRPEGIDSPITELGQGLSGGQARRLALARIFLADYELVLLDEPTAGLDLASQQYLIEGLRLLKTSGKTLVVATHHDSLLAIADRVITVKNGGLHDG